MRESRTYGSVRGALSNERPYRDRRACAPRNAGGDALGLSPDCAVRCRARLHPGYTPCAVARHEGAPGEAGAIGRCKSGLGKA